jgi:YD repeat-containing protein
LSIQTKTQTSSRYTYNAWGERVSKTVFHASEQGDKINNKYQFNQLITHIACANKNASPPRWTVQGASPQTVLTSTEVIF